MTLRPVCLALILGGSIGFLAGWTNSSIAQPPKKDSVLRDPFLIEAPTWPQGDLRTKASDWRTGKVELDKKSAKTKQDLDLIAKIIIYPVTDRKYFTPNIEQKIGSGGKQITELANPQPDTTMDGVMNTITSYVLTPNQVTDSPYFQKDYINEFGKSLDLAIQDVIKRAGNDPKAAIVRVNIGRALAIACRSGATAHVPMLVDLISKESTPPELQFQALRAAENLIAAGDITRIREKPEVHSMKDEELAPLLNALEKAIERYSQLALPPAPPPPPPAATPAVPPAPATKPVDPQAAAKAPAAPEPPKPEGRIETVVTPPPYDADVAMYLRKQAVRALAKCRKVHFWDANQTLARPGVLLAKFAVGDPTVQPSATPAEYCDAAIGLSQMVPDPKVNYDVQLDALAAGVAGYARWKVANPDMKEVKTLQWKKTAQQLLNAMQALKVLPDKSPVAGANRQKVTGLVDVINREVLDPIKSEQENVAATSARPDEVFRWRFEPANQRKTDLLIKDDAKSKVTLPPTVRR